MTKLVITANMDREELLYLRKEIDIALGLSVEDVVQNIWNRISPDGQLFLTVCAEIQLANYGEFTLTDVNDKLQWGMKLVRQRKMNIGRSEKAARYRLFKTRYQLNTAYYRMDLEVAERIHKLANR